VLRAGAHSRNIRSEHHIDDGPAKSPDQCLPRVRQFASIPRLVVAARTGAQRQEKQKRNRSEFHPLSSSDWSEEVLLQNV
jgi:hypothetical protein